MRWYKLAADPFPFEFKGKPSWAEGTHQVPDAPSEKALQLVNQIETLMAGARGKLLQMSEDNLGKIKDILSQGQAGGATLWDKLLGTPSAEPATAPAATAPAAPPTGVAKPGPFERPRTPGETIIPELQETMRGTTPPAATPGDTELSDYHQRLRGYGDQFGPIKDPGIEQFRGKATPSKLVEKK